jgi:hypothetical protein
MLGRGIVFRTINRTQFALAGNAALQLRADFIGSPFLERIGTTSRE